MISGLNLLVILRMWNRFPLCKTLRQFARIQDGMSLSTPRTDRCYQGFPAFGRQPCTCAESSHNAPLSDCFSIIFRLLGRWIDRCLLLSWILERGGKTPRNHERMTVPIIAQFAISFGSQIKKWAIQPKRSTGQTDKRICQKEGQSQASCQVFSSV